MMGFIVGSVTGSPRRRFDSTCQTWEPICGKSIPRPFHGRVKERHYRIVWWAVEIWIRRLADKYEGRWIFEHRWVFEGGAENIEGVDGGRREGFCPERRFCR